MIRVSTHLALGRRAVAALEFALSMPVLLLLLAGATDFGFVFYERSALAGAVASAGQYAYLTGTTVTATNVTTLVRSNSGLSSASVSMSSPTACYCVTGATPTKAAVTCGATCSDGSAAAVYLTVSATYAHQAFLGSFSMLDGRQFTESVTVRMQ
jgi:Flp pilus assembly protein TadG